MNIESLEEIFRPAAIGIIAPEYAPPFEIVGESIKWDDCAIGLVKYPKNNTLFVLASTIDEDNIMWFTTPYVVQTPKNPQDESPLLSFYKSLIDGSLAAEVKELNMTFEKLRSSGFILATLSEESFEYKIPGLKTHFEDLQALLDAKDQDALIYVEQHPSAGRRCLGCYLDYQKQRR